MDVTRRKFVKYVIVGGAATGTAAVVLTLPGSLRTRVRHLLVDSRMPEGVKGALSPAGLATLGSFTSTLLGDSIEGSHYDAMFNLRAERISGHRELIESFAVALDEGSMDLDGSVFSQLPEAKKLKMVSKLTDLRASEVERLTALVVHPKWILINRHIVDPILTQFARSDAWLRLGYAAYPGYPRGLDAYTRKPRDAFE